MSRQTIKGITGYLKRNREESSSENNTDNQDANYDKLVADMAKGFMEAQSQVTKPVNQNTEMLDLLEKMSMQINELKNNLDNNGNNTESQKNQSNSSQQQQDITAQNIKELLGSLLQANTNDNAQQNNENKNNQNTQNINKTAVQSAAQVLTQAQYELSNELEASLTKLRQVISKSEKIANRISTLLGTENKK